MVQQSLDALGDQLVYPFEIAVVVRIGHFLPFPAGDEIGEEMHPFPIDSEPGEAF